MNEAAAALLNGAILSAPVTLAIWLGLRVTPRRTLNAATRYVLWWSALAVAVMLPILYLPMERANRRAPHFAPGAAAPTTLEWSAESSSQQPGSPGSSAAPDLRPRAPQKLRFPIALSAGEWPTWILRAWFAASALLLLRLIASCVLIERRKARALPAPLHLAARVETWLSQCECPRRPVRLATSTEIPAPVVAGLGRPSILFPARLLEKLPADEIDQIGLHEAAHLARRDDYALLVQRALEALFVLHPVVRWIARQIDLEREIACDDFVLRATGQAQSYAACLTRVVELTGGVRGSMVAAAAAEERSHLSRRVDMLLDRTRHTGTHLLRGRLVTAILVVAVLAVVAASTHGLVAFAIAAPAPPAPIEQTAPPAEPASQTSAQIPRSAAPAAGPAAAQPAAPSTPERPSPQVTASVTAATVRVAVAVLDPQNRSVTGLDRENFRIFEDGVEQISEFSVSGDPLSVGIVFDISGSTAAHVPELRRAVAQFLQTAGAQDEFFLIEFNERAELVEGFTPKPDQIQDTLSFARARGGTALRDALLLAIRQMKDARNPRRVLLVVSDGNDNSSSSSENDVKSALAQADLEICAISVYDSAPSVTRPRGEERGAAFLQDIAAQTGGRQFAPLDGRVEQAGTAARIALQNLYVLGFNSKNPAHDGSFRSLRLEVVTPRGIPPLTVRHRAGYYAPRQ